MAQDQTIEIKVQLRDEISKAAEQAVAKLLRLNQVDTSRSTSALDKLGRAASFAGREIRSLASITGIGGILGAGGVVAGLVAAKRSLDEFAQSGMRMHFTARELRVSEGFLRDYTDALKVVGQSEGEAASGIQSGLRTLEEAWTEGRGSRMFKELEKGVGDSGTRLFRELMQSYGRDGPEKALQLALDRMERMNPRAQASFMKIMGFGSVGATELRKILPQLVPVIRMSKDEMLKYNIANVNLERSWNNIKATVGTALLPAFTELTRAVQQYLESPAGKQFLADIKRWATSMADYVRSQGFADRMKAITEGSERLVTDLGAAFTAADKVVQDMGATWPGIFEALMATKFVTWLFGFGTALRFIAPAVGVITALTAFLHDPKKFRESWGDFMRRNRESMEEEQKRRGGKTTQPSDTFNMESPGFFMQILKDLFQGNIDLWGEQGKKRKTGALAPAGEEKGTVEKLAEAAQVRLATGGLKDKLADLDAELGQLTGFLQIGGPDGTAGSSGYGQGTIANDLDRSSFERRFKGSKLAGSYDAIVESAQRHGIPPSLVASIFGNETGFGKSRAIRDYNNPGGIMAGGKGNRLFRSYDTLAAGIDDAVRIQARHYRESDGNLENFFHRKPGGYSPVGAANDPNKTNQYAPRDVGNIQTTLRSWEDVHDARIRRAAELGRAGAFDEGGTTGAELPAWQDAGTRLNANIARADNVYKGSGEVDIDISNVATSKDASISDRLFRPLILEKTPQMAASGNDRSVPSYFNQA